MMKMKRTAVLLLACGLILLPGCKRQPDAEVSGEPEKPVEEEVNVSEGDLAGEEEILKEETGTYPRELENPELREFTIWINNGNHYGNYGFLLSEYEKPQDMNLNELFYAGAGIECEQLSAKEQAAYLKATGQDEIYTDCTRLTGKQIDDFLKQRIGVSYEDMTYPLEWVYLPEFDIYVNEHGDTNYMNFTCVSGRQIGADTYELDCVPGNDLYTPCLPSCRLTLKKNKADYQPVSNIYVDDLSYSMDIWRIEDQCFKVALEGWGTVNFISYEPDRSAYGTRDVMFALEKEGEIYQLPAVAEDNYRIGESFSQVLAVSFQDYDEDGDTDIIIIAEYISEENESEETMREVRLYRNDPDGQRFVPEFDRMDILNGNQWNHTIREVMEHTDRTWKVED